MPIKFGSIKIKQILNILKVYIKIIKICKITAKEFFHGINYLKIIFHTETEKNRKLGAYNLLHIIFTVTP